MFYLTLFIAVSCFCCLILLLFFVCFYVRFESRTLARICPQRSQFLRNHRRSSDAPPCCGAGPQRPHNRSDHLWRSPTTFDRQGNIFTISDNPGVNTGPNRYGDLFFLEASIDEAARMRAQREKDDKELPSYDEVMHLTGPASPVLNTSTNVTAPALVVPAPPYSEIDPNALSMITTNATPPPMPESHAPSTSRAAAASSVTLSVSGSNAASSMIA